MRCPALQLAHGPGCSGRRVLDELGLVEDHRRPIDGGEHIEVAGEQAVGGDDEVTGGECRRRFGAIAVGAVAPCSMVDGDGHRRGEAAGLGLPVVDDGQRTHHQVRAGTIDEVGERRRRLAEAHVVGEAAAQSEPVEEPQPAEAATLVWPQPPVNHGGSFASCEFGVGQTAEQQSRPRFRHRVAGDGVDRVDGADAEVVAGCGRIGGELQQRQRTHGAVALGAGQLLDRGAGRRRAGRAPCAAPPGRCAPSGCRRAAATPRCARRAPTRRR